LTTPSRQTHFPSVLMVGLKDNITAPHQASPLVELAHGALADEAGSEDGEDEEASSEVQKEEHIGEVVADAATVVHQVKARTTNPEVLVAMDVIVVVVHREKARKRARNRGLLLPVEWRKKERLAMGLLINTVVLDAMAEEDVVEDLEDGVIMDAEDHLLNLADQEDLI